MIRGLDMKCPDCGKDNWIKKDRIVDKDIHQPTEWICKNCGKKIYSPP